MTVAHQLLEAATHLTSLYTGLTQLQSRAICESCTYGVLRMHGYKRMPLPSDPLAERRAMIEEIAQGIGDELRKRGIAPDQAGRVRQELVDLYGRIRPLAEGAGAAG